MKKQLIRLTESDLHMIIENTISDILNERHVIKIPKQEAPMGDAIPPMEDDSMGGDPSMEDPNDMGSEMPPMDGQEDMGEEMPPMSNGNMGGEPNQELMDTIGQLGMEDQNAVLKYAKSMIDDGDGQDTMTNDNQMPMESTERFNSIISEIIQDFFDDNKKEVRDTNKKITNNKINKRNPFISNR